MKLFRMSEDINNKNIIFHFYHKNAIRDTNPFLQQNRAETDYVKSLTKQQLLDYIQTW
jgi:hypothetical protein